ncbi:DMT family transporter [Lacibacter sp. H407]|uniref:DMT family transporter n=1 Tax=Lacibacter sp. H407 TaxID=3133423 RepID=UPI0030C3E9E4
MKVAWLFIALLGGALLPIQAGLNAKLGKSIASPVHASMVSFITGTLAVALFILLKKQSVSWAGIKSAPGYVWIAGALGAFYVTAVILAFPRIGPALTFGLVVLGQMLISILLDHFNILVHQQHSLNICRIVGIFLIVSGVIIIRKF